ncbi:hypothetical protein HK104_003564 [Borealophlyctis nickersoniae]|nr:hypothetical protein HK104_003564 [Borealophlyctis nickersoniae]
MSSNAPPPQYEATVSTASDTPTDALRMRTAATTSTDRTHAAPSPAKFVYKHRTEEAYLEAVKKFKSDMEGKVSFNDMQGWVVYLACAQLVAIPVWCVLNYVAYRAVMRNKGGDEIIINIMYGVMFLCLNLQGVLAYLDPRDGFWGYLHMFTGYVGFIGAVGMVAEAAVWFHHEFWNLTQADVLRELRE